MGNAEVAKHPLGSDGRLAWLLERSGKPDPMRPPGLDNEEYVDWLIGLEEGVSLNAARGGKITEQRNARLRESDPSALVASGVLAQLHAHNARYGLPRDRPHDAGESLPDDLADALLGKWKDGQPVDEPGPRLTVYECPRCRRRIALLWTDGKKRAYLHQCRY